MKITLIFTVLITSVVACRSHSSSTPTPAPVSTPEAPDPEDEAKKAKEIEEEKKKAEQKALQLTNNQLPIIFGNGAAGIDLSMTATQVKANTGVPDSIAVFARGYQRAEWQFGEMQGIDKIIVDSTYQGTLALPAPYGDVKMGQDFSKILADPLALNTFANTLFSKFVDASVEDCVSLALCRIETVAGGVSLTLPAGGLDFNVEHRLSGVSIATPFYFYDARFPVMIYGKALAGITFETPRNVVDHLIAQVFDPFYDAYEEMYYFQTSSAAVKWGKDNLPSRIFSVNGGVPPDAKNHAALALGRGEFLQISSIFDMNPTSLQNKIIELFNKLENKPAGFDCTSGIEPTCALGTADLTFRSTVWPNLLTMTFPKARLYIDKETGRLGVIELLK